MNLLSPGSIFPSFHLHGFRPADGFVEVICPKEPEPNNPRAFRSRPPAEADSAAGSNSASNPWSLFVFYPADFTFVCPTELEDLANHQAEFDKMGVLIHSVSTDTHFAHKAWHDMSPAIGRIRYTMLGDPSHALSRATGALDEETGLARRVTYLVDPDGVIQFVEATADGIGRSAQEVLAKIKAAQHVRSFPGEVCPAKWADGDSTLKPSLDLVGKI